MLHQYTQSAMDQATYQIMDDGRYYGEIPPIPGVWSEADSLESCRLELIEVLDEWVILSLKRGDPLPPMGDIDLNRIGAHAQTD